MTIALPQSIHVGGSTFTQPDIGSPIPGDCNSLTTNYRLVQKMTSNERCTDVLVKTEYTQSNREGIVTVPTLCFAFDWRAGMCYDRTNIDEPIQVACSTTGPNVVHVTTVFTDTLSGTTVRATKWLSSNHMGQAAACRLLAQSPELTPGPLRTREHPSSHVRWGYPPGPN